MAGFVDFQALSPSRVVVALSGGVDSAVAAALLARAGWEVEGVMLDLWKAPGFHPYLDERKEEGHESAAQVARKLGIPFRLVDAKSQFKERVVRYFIETYAQGGTPNPCVRCNRVIKWSLMRQAAAEAGARYLATGHYARIKTGRDGLFELWKGTDESKDQAYMLSRLTQDDLESTLFPIGNLTKMDVKQLSKQFELEVEERAESQDVCFLDHGDYRAFLRTQVPGISQPGEIINRHGSVLGEHEGLAFYTIGQRKGLPAVGKPLFVLDKDLEKNTLIVGFAEELGSGQFDVKSINWISGFPPSDTFTSEVKIRYKAQPVSAQVQLSDPTSAAVSPTAILRDVTPGQTCVFYDGSRVLGGGEIA